MVLREVLICPQVILDLSASQCVRWLNVGFCEANVPCVSELVNHMSRKATNGLEMSYKTWGSRDKGIYDTYVCREVVVPFYCMLLHRLNLKLYPLLFPKQHFLPCK
jgi:hypothetical protein